MPHHLYQSIKVKKNGTADSPEKQSTDLIQIERKFRAHPSVGSHSGRIAVANMN